ncbi:MAG: L-threonylcarbamoyladenylate synthase [Gammaproteobacteria bacterium]|nr:L-threonylcarbamoyladenylate synthase [Gammaproteobacteria bacterium]
MSDILQIHPDNPQPRLIAKAANIVTSGGLIVYPTDSCYALGCSLGNKEALDRIRQIRQVDTKHNFTLVCRDLSELGLYSVVDNSSFRLLKSHTPGPYTFVLKATREVPKRMQQPKRRTIGLRIPEHTVTQALLEQLDQPLMSSTLLLPSDEEPLSDIDEISQRLGHLVDLVIDGGYCGTEATTVVDLADDGYQVLRQGKKTFPQ